MDVRRIGLPVAALAVGAAFLVGGARTDDEAREGIVMDARIDVQTPGRIETATFALGCFWGPDGRFGVLPGVIRTRVGYAGGTAERPTYHDIDGHAEAIQVDFDPSVVSYGDLLEVFWNSHDPFRPPHSSQYRSMIFVHDEAQRLLAMASFDAQGSRPLTEVVAVERFTRAEDYHQKYRLQHETALIAELRGRFVTFDAFVDSTVAARVNGYLAGWGSAAWLEEEIASFALTEHAEEILRRCVE